ncbi:sensor domain-containing diguanylate cyclase [Herminiimonas aquatilis]|uniref:Diguanylate cyclase n=1 Tax=Herminiimonas aquatilis TaxID=345342 RepID=A0ABW2J2Y2_9BURK
MDFDFSHHSLTTDNLTLAHLARGAPLVQTLISLINEVEVKNHELILSLFLSEENHCLRLLATSNLPPAYCSAINQMIVDGAQQFSGRDMEASGFFSSLRDMAKTYGLHVASSAPIPYCMHGTHGLFIAHFRQAQHTSDACQQAINNAAVLASIAIAHHDAEARIRKAEDALRNNETIMALAIDGSQTGIWDRNIQTNQINYSNGWKAMLGYSPHEISSHLEESYTRIHPDDLASVKAAMQAHFDHKTDSYVVEHRIRCKDGSYKWISSRGKIVQHDASGRPSRMVGTTTDITAIRALSEELQQNVKLITSLTNEVPGLVYQYTLKPNGDAFFSYASEGIRDIYEIEAEQVAENIDAIIQLIHPEDLPRYQDSLRASAINLAPWHLEYRVVLPRQGLRWRQVDARPRKLADGSILWHGFITNITERKRIEIELEGFATIDFLTQIPNRRYFLARMGEELARIQRVAHARAAVLMCDLDHFKDVNDRHGHAAGDLVLKHFAVILRNATRKIDTAGRVGGEEFAVVLADAGIAEARIFAERIAHQIATTPVLVGDLSIYVTVSIGISVMHANDVNTDAALSRSDSALYMAKDMGRNRIEVSDV